MTASTPINARSFVESKVKSFSQLWKKAHNQIKLIFTKATKENDYLLNYNYRIGPHFNDKKWITGLSAQGIFVDRRTGHTERKNYFIQFKDDESLFAGPQGLTNEFAAEAFQIAAKTKLQATNHLLHARKTINTAIAIQAVIISGIIAVGLFVIAGFYGW